MLLEDYESFKQGGKFKKIINFHKRDSTYPRSLLSFTQKQICKVLKKCNIKPWQSCTILAWLPSRQLHVQS